MKKIRIKEKEKLEKKFVVSKAEEKVNMQVSKCKLVKKNKKDW